MQPTMWCTQGLRSWPSANLGEAYTRVLNRGRENGPWREEEEGPRNRDDDISMFLYDSHYARQVTER
jgi:hypothetical protein